MFTLILALIGTLFHLYVFWHVATLPRLRQGRAFRAVALLAALLWLLFVLGVLLGHDGQGALAAQGERLAMDGFGLLFILTTSLFVSDLLSLAFYRCAVCRLWLRRLGLGAGVLLGVVALWQGGRAPVVIEHEVSLPDLPAELAGTRLVVLTDLHLGSQFGAEWLASRARQVAVLQPDLVVLVGDLFEGHGEPDASLEEAFRQLRAPLGVYAVTGNHEHFGDSPAALELSERAGVQWLRDQTLSPLVGLNLAGVDDLTIRWRRGSMADHVTPLLRQAPPGATILLSHSPLQVEQAAAAGAGLMLSGHTHGGQIWPFGYLVQQFYPHLAGRFQVDGMTLIVSRGTGLWGPRMRLWSPGEILLLRLHPATIGE